MAQLRGSVNSVLAAVLALLLVWGFSPLSAGVRSGLTVFILLLFIPGMVYAWRQYGRLKSAHSAHEVLLPPESFSGPVVLVCGDNDPLFAGRGDSCESSQGWYLPASGATINVETSVPQLVFVVNEPVSSEQSSATVFATQTVHGTRRMWLGFAIGVMVTAVVSTGAFLGITHMCADGYELVKPLPQMLTPEQLSTLRQSSDLKEQKQEIIAATQGQLDVLHDLSPLWSREYAASLAQQLVTLWPEESQTTTFVSGLQKALTTEALPESALQNWHDAQQGLDALTARLNMLDERKGKYLTGSELKSAIFTIRRQLDQTPPTEELLRQIDDELKKQGSVSPALYQQLDMRINQLLNRYMLLKESATGRD